MGRGTHGRCARALDRTEEADAVVADAEEQLGTQRARLADVGPLTVGIVNKYGGSFGVPGDEDGQSVVLEELGLELLDLGLGGTATDLSEEQLGLLADADVILVEDFDPAETEELLASPAFASLPAVQEGRAARLSDAVTRGAYLLSALSLPYAARATPTPCLRRSAATVRSRSRAPSSRVASPIALRPASPLGEHPVTRTGSTPATRVTGMAEREQSATRALVR